MVDLRKDFIRVYEADRCLGDWGPVFRCAIARNIWPLTMLMTMAYLSYMCGIVLQFSICKQCNLIIFLRHNS